MSLLRNALQAGKGIDKKEKTSEALTFNGPVVDADEVLGRRDSGADESVKASPEQREIPLEEPAFSDGSGVEGGLDPELAGGLRPDNDELISTEPDIRQPRSPVDATPPSDTVVTDGNNSASADSGFSNAGVQYTADNAAVDVKEAGTDFHGLAIDDPSSQELILQEHSLQEHLLKEHSSQEHSSQEQSAQSFPYRGNTVQPASIESSIPPGAKGGATELPPSSNTTQTQAVELHADGLESSAAKMRARPGVNLDPLFFIIIAFACAGLFGSLYALVTQNDAFVSAEYADLRARQAGLDDLAANRRMADTTTTAVPAVTDPGVADSGVTDSDDGASHSSGTSATASTTPHASDASYQLEAAQSDGAGAVSDHRSELKSTVDTAADSQRVNGANSPQAPAADKPAVVDTVIADNVTEQNSSAMQRSGAVQSSDAVQSAGASQNAGGTQDPADTRELVATQTAEDSQRDIALLQQELNELRQSLASQDTKLSALLSDSTASSTVAPAANRPSGQPITSDTTAPALDKAGEVIVMENSAGGDEGSSAGNGADNFEPVNGGSSSLTRQLVETVVEMSAPATGLTGPRAGSADARVQANRSGHWQTDFPQVLGRAFHAYTIGDFNQAGTLYSRALQLDPYNRDANLGVAAVAVKNGNYTIAIERYRHLLSLQPDDVVAFSSMLNLVSATRDSALENEMVVHSSQYRHVPTLHAALGNHYSQTLRWAEASRSYASAVQLAPETADYLYNLAVSLDNLGDTQAAVETYHRALSLSEIGNFTFSQADAAARVQALLQTR